MKQATKKSWAYALFSPNALRLCVGGGLLSLSSSAYGGNLDAFYLSGDAALVGGAITAKAEGGGAAWYNPAGLGRLRGMRLDASMNAYMIRFGGESDFDSPHPAADVTRLTHLDLNLVPAGLTLTKNWGDVGFALGVFVPTQSSVILRTLVKIEEPMRRLDFGYDLSARYQEYHLGPAVGWAPFRDWSIGASALVTYRTLQQIQDLYLDVVPGDGALAPGVVLAHDTLDWVQVGLELVLGVQWQLTQSWAMGAVVRAPAIRLGQDLQKVSAQVASTHGAPAVSSVDFSEEIGLAPSIVAPARFHTGFAFDRDKDRFAFDLSLQMPMTNDAIQLAWRPVLNARLGGRRKINDIFAVGGGIFTDRSPQMEPREFGDGRIDYYGLTGSIALGKPYGIVSRGEERFDRPKTLLFETTISLSYALGVGKVIGAIVDFNDAGFASYIETPSSVVAHEISLHIGATVSE